MAPRHRTQILILLLVASAIAAGGAWSMLETRRDRAITSQKDRSVCITELASISGSAPATVDSASADHLTINRRLRAAAVAARLADQLASIDPGSTARVRDTDYMQTPIYLRMNAVTLKQLVGFLYELSITDNSLRTTDIELSEPLIAPGNRTDPGDLWTADVTLNCLTYQQRQPSESR